MRFLSIFIFVTLATFFVDIAVIAQSGSKVPPTVLSPMVNDKVRELFQKEKYAEAESVYLKMGDTDIYWLALFKGKQDKITEAVGMIKDEIAKQKTDQQRAEAIEKGIAIISDFSPDEAIRFLDEFEKNPAIGNNLNMICFRVRYLMRHNNFDKANVLVGKLIQQSSSISDKITAENIENTLYSMVSELYARRKIEEALAFFDLLSEQYPKIRLNPGMQLLWARIALQNKRGMDALKKIDWVMGTFPDHCKNNQDMVLITKAQAFEAVGDRNESRQLWEQLHKVIQSNPKYRGIQQIVDSKLREYRQDEESIKRMQKVAEEAAKNPYGFAEENISKNNWPVSRIVLCILGVFLIVVALIRIVQKKNNIFF